MEQRSNEWYIERMGKITAFNFHTLAAPKGIGDGGMTYIRMLVANCLGARAEEASSASLRWGIELEDDARYYYYYVMKDHGYDFDISLPGFINHKIFDCGISPDGLIENSHGIEIKCPYVPGIHVNYMMVKDNESLKKIEKKNYWQIMFSLWVTGLKSWDFISYDPRFTGKHRMHIAKIFPAEQSFIEGRVIEALKIRDEILTQVK